MPDIASVFKQEIARLARKELRNQTEYLKKAAIQYRSEIAALKRRTESLEKQLSKIQRGTLPKEPAVKEGNGAARVRFSAKGLSAHRRRLDLSAADMGTLLGVSGQTIYNWEAGTTRPRESQLEAIASIRNLGKREANARLGQLSAGAE